MKQRHEDTRTLGEQAAEWLVICQDGEAAQRVAFIAWLKQSPRHIEEFLFAAAAWKALCDSESRRSLDVEDILAQLSAAAASSNVVTLARDSAVEPEREAAAVSPQHIHGVSNAHPIRSRSVWAAGFAALLLIALVGWWTFGMGTTYATHLGEQRTVRLQDGSLLYLNTDSRAQVRFTARTRQIELLKGEALFAVSHDAARPFRVRTDEVIVQAVGTQFNVRRFDGSTHVAVIEGRVKVAHDEAALTDASGTAEPGDRGMGRNDASVGFLAAGEQATITANESTISSAADITEAIAWRERRLVFHNERLATVAAEINRYGTRHFRVEGKLAQDTRLTATFNVDKLESLIAFLQQYSELSVETRDDVVVIQAR